MSSKGRKHTQHSFFILQQTTTTTAASEAMFSSFSSSLHGSSLQLLQPKQQHYHKPKASSSLVCLNVRVEDIAEIAQNKVLVAAVVSCAIGQLTKPFTTSLLYGEKINLRRLVGAGGFPSTHSASVVAAATSLGLERGLSDSIFAMALIFAGIVMYDSQAVRREAGIHAKILNKTHALKAQSKPILSRNKDSPIDSKAGSSIPTKSETLAPLLPNSESRSTLTLTSEKRSSTVPSSLAIDCDSVSRETYRGLFPLEESIGHTTTEVVAGALLGFLVTLTVYNLM